MYQNILTQAGLSTNEAKIYNILLEKGGLLGGEISKNSRLKRGLVYKVLNDLEAKNLIAKNKVKKLTIFAPLHPKKLRDALSSKEQKIRLARKELEAHLPKMADNLNSPLTKHFKDISEIKQFLDNLQNNKNQTFILIMT